MFASSVTVQAVNDDAVYRGGGYNIHSCRKLINSRRCEMYSQLSECLHCFQNWIELRDQHSRVKKWKDDGKIIFEKLFLSLYKCRGSDNMSMTS